MAIEKDLGIGITLGVTVETIIGTEVAVVVTAVQNDK